MTFSFACNHTNMFDDFALPINELSSENPFVEFDLGLDADQIEMINTLNITRNNSVYTAYSGKAKLLEREFYNFISDISSNNTEVATNLSFTLSKLIDTMYKQMKSQHLWLAISANTEINRPSRWHTDVPYRYDSLSNGFGLQLDLDENQCFHRMEYFVLFTLKGSHTDFFNLDHNLRDQYINYLRIEDRVERQKQIHLMIDESQVSTATLGKGYLSLNGAHFGALHSRPSHSTERLFIAFGEIDPISLEFFEAINSNFSLAIPAGIFYTP